MNRINEITADPGIRSAEIEKCLCLQATTAEFKAVVFDRKGLRKVNNIQSLGMRCKIAFFVLIR